MSTDKNVSKNFQSDPIGSESLIDLQKTWEFELDLMGTTASIDVLERHLDIVPDAESATAHFLKGFIASHAHTH